MSGTSPQLAMFPDSVLGSLTSTAGEIYHPSIVQAASQVLIYSHLALGLHSLVLTAMFNVITLLLSPCSCPSPASRAKWPRSTLLLWIVRLIRITVGNLIVREAAAVELNTVIRAPWARPNEPTTCCFPLTTVTRQMVILTSNLANYSLPKFVIGSIPTSFPVCPQVEYHYDLRP